MSSPVAGFYVAWLRPDEWDKLKRACPDLQETYEEWLASAEAGVAVAERQGHHVEKIVLTLEDIRGRQRSTGRKVDSRIRARMAVEIGYKRNSTRH